MTGTIVARARRLGLSVAGDDAIDRCVPVEAPVAIEYNGLGYAVMMATPEHLEDFARGFTLSEGLVAGADIIEGIDVHEAGDDASGGWIVRIALPPEAMERVIARARTRVSESSCGLCGMDNIAEVLRPMPPVNARIAVTRDGIARALASLSAHQPLGRETGAMHAAAFCAPDGAILCAAEDVGRHNALDKLIGAMARAGLDAGTGFILLSARCSFELVEKTVRAGCPLLVTISAPTSLAVERAQAAGLALVALARDDCALIFGDPHGILQIEEEA
ncbi:formate dehydrogenase accessory sulfurtransferase FdhD [Croceicoccus ponticola]|uniref:Sulfur carrier protein FdhD n=1 Tax=Croceicoccus ponticola TaxID=2217664 RepID=A0A437H136_9SPHN|nr:formate dehydrogenase accessory sulfurtransferase FdhD [Croceicoccus ponticola]RVQ69286.1 formate dehydrogenase accessory sulfurtransferase FdhD [Croceicoccus ponticola]